MTRKANPAQVEEAVRLYHSLRLTEAEVARVMQVSERTVRRWLAGTARSTGPRRRTSVNDTLILDLKDREGLSFAEIGRRAGLSKTGARMRYYALTGRERPERRKQPGEHATQTTTGETS